MSKPILAALLSIVLTCGVFATATTAQLTAENNRSLTLDVQPLDLPQGRSCRYPDLTCGPDGSLYVSWLEQVDERKHRLMGARLEDGEFKTAFQIAEGENWFVNWADFPSIAAGRDGRLAVHWLERLGSSTYAYGIRLSISRDHGQNWSEPVWLHDDQTPNEHGFVSMAAMGDGSFWAVWLDSRTMKETGCMSLYGRVIRANGSLGPEHQLDDCVCSCCQTSIAAVGNRLVVAYRDVTEENVRDISTVSWSEENGWTKPERVAADDWVIYT